MNYEINGTSYPVEIVRKANAHTYIRIKDDFTIQVSTNYFTTKQQILKMLEENHSALVKMISKKQEEAERESKFYILGQSYDIIIVPVLNKVEVEGNKIYTKDEKTLLKWYQKEMTRIFQEHLDNQYHRFIEKIPYPKLKIRSMKTRWGVCNRKNITVTLNSKLMNYDEEKLDYVIIHELSHFVHFDHSKEFWNVVSKYCKDYKRIRKELRD